MSLKDELLVCFQNQTPNWFLQLYTPTSATVQGVNTVPTLYYSTINTRELSISLAGSGTDGWVREAIKSLHLNSEWIVPYLLLLPLLVNQMLPLGDILGHLQHDLDGLVQYTLDFFQRRAHHNCWKSQHNVGLEQRRFAWLLIFVIFGETVYHL